MNRQVDAVVQDSPPKRVTWGLASVAAGDVAVGMTDDGRLCKVSFLRGKEAVSVVEQWQRDWPATQFKVGKVPKAWQKLPLLMVGTELQRIIWLEIMELKAGEVVSYGELADRIGAPGRARAVGRACKMCDLAWVVPCHRVIGANGIGGFGLDGTAFKEELLKAEGVVIGAGRRRS